MDQTVLFRCVKEGSRLRVRVISPGYNSDANCQFPRAIRKDGGMYSAPVHALRFSQGPRGKFFYRVNGNFVTEIENGSISEQPVLPNISKIYGDEEEECCVCMASPKNVVFSPCGHYSTCDVCATQLSNKCPVCRGRIEVIVKRSEIQI